MPKDTTLSNMASGSSPMQLGPAIATFFAEVNHATCALRPRL